MQCCVTWRILTCLARVSCSDSTFTCVIGQVDTWAKPNPQHKMNTHVSTEEHADTEHAAVPEGWRLDHVLDPARVPAMPSSSGISVVVSIGHGATFTMLLGEDVKLKDMSPVVNTVLLAPAMKQALKRLEWCDDGPCGPRCPVCHYLKECGHRQADEGLKATACWLGALLGRAYDENPFPSKPSKSADEMVRDFWKW